VTTPLSGTVCRPKAMINMYDQHFFASSHACGTIKRNMSKSAFSDGGGSL